MRSRTPDNESNEGYIPIANTRRHPRYETTIRLRADGLVSERRGDVSARGFCVEAGREFCVGEWLELSVRLPGSGEWVHLWGRVLGCHRRGGRIYVRGWFARIRRHHKTCLRQWIDSHSPVRRAA